MKAQKYLERLPVFEITKYDGTRNYRSTAVCFSGAPRKHPYDREKIILVISPFGSQAVFFEFSLKDIVHVEDLPHIVTEGGESIRMAELWIRKNAKALRFQAFKVTDAAEEGKKQHDGDASVHSRN